jgi:hypothetical protein
VPASADARTSAPLPVRDAPSSKNNLFEEGPIQ